MEHRQLGRSGLKVSAFCLGAMTFGESQTFMKGVTAPDDEARRMLDAALAAGVDFVDTADVYSDGRSEELLGQWLGTRRRDVILATKCRFALGTSKPRPMDQGLSRRHILFDRARSGTSVARITPAIASPSLSGSPTGETSSGTSPFSFNGPSSSEAQNARSFPPAAPSSSE